MPTGEEVDSILRSIDALIGVSAALSQSRKEFLNFEQEDSLRYDDQLKITWWNPEKAKAGQRELESRLRMLIEELGLKN